MDGRITEPLRGGVAEAKGGELRVWGRRWVERKAVDSLANLEEQKTEGLEPRAPQT